MKHLCFSFISDVGSGYRLICLLVIFFERLLIFYRIVRTCPGCQLTVRTCASDSLLSYYVQIPLHYLARNIVSDQVFIRKKSKINLGQVVSRKKSDARSATS